MISKVEPENIHRGIYCQTMSAQYNEAMMTNTRVVDVITVSVILKPICHS